MSVLTQHRGARPRRSPVTDMGSCNVFSVFMFKNLHRVIYVFLLHNFAMFIVSSVNLKPFEFRVPAKPTYCLWQDQLAQDTQWYTRIPAVMLVDLVKKFLLEPPPRDVLRTNSPIPGKLYSFSVFVRFLWHMWAKLRTMGESSGVCPGYWQQCLNRPFLQKQQPF